MPMTLLGKNQGKRAAVRIGPVHFCKPEVAGSSPVVSTSLRLLLFLVFCRVDPLLGANPRRERHGHGIRFCAHVARKILQAAGMVEPVTGSTPSQLLGGVR